MQGDDDHVAPAVVVVVAICLLVRVGARPDPEAARAGAGDGAEGGGDAGADVGVRHGLVVADGAGLDREAVHVHERQLGGRVGREEVLVPGVDAAVAAEEVDGGRGQVHDEVGDCRRDGDALLFLCRRRGGGAWLGLGLGLGLALGDDGVLAVARGGQDGVGGLVDEDAAVLAERADEFSYLAGCEQTKHEAPSRE